MKCYQHEENEAIGTCKHCCKAVCWSCVSDTGSGLACSADCENEVKILREMMEKSSVIYRVGSKSKIPPSGVILIISMGVLFLGFGIYESLNSLQIDYFSITMGVVYLLIGIFAYFQTRKAKLSC